MGVSLSGLVSAREITLEDLRGKKMAIGATNTPYKFFSQNRGEIRAENRERGEAALKEGDFEKVKMYAQGAARLPPEMSQQAKNLLDAMGVPWMQAPSEGEAEASCLARKGRVWRSEEHTSELQ